jgi:D-arginine dehydrogenase
MNILKTFDTEALVIGGGFAGLATAHYLAESGFKGVVVIEQEPKLGGHASGRNAGMIRQAISDAALLPLAVEGRKALQSAEKKGWNIGFQPYGSLLTAKGQKIKELQIISSLLTQNGVRSEMWPRQKAVKKISLLKNADFEMSLFCPSDAFIDIEKLIQAFLNKLKALQVPVCTGEAIVTVNKIEGGFEVLTSRRSIRAKRIVNAAGAWAGLIADKAGASKIPFKAYRRHLFELEDLPFQKNWPFTWDLSHDIYFRPLGNRLMASPCDKKLFILKFGKKTAAAESADPRLENKLKNKFKKFTRSDMRYRIADKKAGLRTMTPDGRFVVGEDPMVRNFFWVAGLGGHGVTTCFSVARLAGNLIMNKKREKAVVSALSPKRFL